MRLSSDINKAQKGNKDKSLEPPLLNNDATEETNIKNIWSRSPQRTYPEVGDRARMTWDNGHFIAVIKPFTQYCPTVTEYINELCALIPAENKWRLF